MNDSSQVPYQFHSERAHRCAIELLEIDRQGGAPEEIWERKTQAIKNACHGVFIDATFRLVRRRIRVHHKDRVLGYDYIVRLIIRSDTFNVHASEQACFGIIGTENSAKDEQMILVFPSTKIFIQETVPVQLLAVVF